MFQNRKENNNNKKTLSHKCSLNLIQSGFQKVCWGEACTVCGEKNGEAVHVQALADVGVTVTPQAWLQNDMMSTDYNIHITMIISDSGTNKKGNGTNWSEITEKNIIKIRLELVLLLHYV